MKRLRDATFLSAALLAVIVVLGAAVLGGCGAGVSAADTRGAPTTSPSAKATAQATDAASLSDADGMPTIGIIGGVSWVSSKEYYRLMNEMVRDRFGPDYSADILMYSIPFGEFSKQEKLAAQGDWAPLRRTMVDAAQRLKRGGAAFVVIASNTMNSTADLIEQKVGIPVLRIQDPVGAAVKAKGIDTIALLGTKYTMEEQFYRGRLTDKFGLKVVTPNLSERNYINTVIFDELCAGVFKKASRDRFVRIIERLVAEEGAQGVILGCTEIPLLVKQKDVSVPVFDTTLIHSAAAVRESLGED